MTNLVHTEEALLRSHPYAATHVESDRRLHGGFDAAGRYVSPRLLVRGPAIAAWTEALRARGGDLLPADASLLAGIRVPSPAQMKLLMREGLGQTFWNTLTITGHIEARGRILTDLRVTDFAQVVAEDVSNLAVGHLGKGLLRAHGLDEGGEPAAGIGGHDVMWFALRDLAFGEVDYPEPEVPGNIARPEAQLELPAGLGEGTLRTIDFLANLLMIELRAELGFALTETLLRDPDLFRERRAQAERAAEIVERIRRDEEIHVTSLRLYLGELRQLHFLTDSGARIPGAEVVDPIWNGIVHWATQEQPKLVAERQRQLLAGRIRAHPDATRIQAEFDALAEAG